MVNCNIYVYSHLKMLIHGGVKNMLLPWIYGLKPWAEFTPYFVDKPRVKYGLKNSFTWLLQVQFPILRWRGPILPERAHNLICIKNYCTYWKYTKPKLSEKTWKNYKLSTWFQQYHIRQTKFSIWHIYTPLIKVIKKTEPRWNDISTLNFFLHAHRREWK